MKTERRAEKRHVISTMWATVGSSPEKCDVCDIGRANARIRNVPGELATGELRRVTFYLTLLDGRAIAVPVKGTVMRVDEREAAITYDPPARTWQKMLETLSRQRFVPA